MSQALFTAKEAKNNFGRLLDEAQRRPVTIKKSGRNFAHVLSDENYSEYERFEAIVDAYWGKRAMQAAKKGFLGVAESEKFLKSILNAKN